MGRSKGVYRTRVVLDIDHDAKHYDVELKDLRTSFMEGHDTEIRRELTRRVEELLTTALEKLPEHVEVHTPSSTTVYLTVKDAAHHDDVPPPIYVQIPDLRSQYPEYDGFVCPHCFNVQVRPTAERPVRWACLGCHSLFDAPVAPPPTADLMRHPIEPVTARNRAKPFKPASEEGEEK